ncbi:cytochrome P450 [Amniculicola lignicola CBS 123094]|uniref:Cytochrome P450 n=1 Tax=Amniculicola lignicola CBS 123094 TaxID=1392246 RepID=A0A6A5WE42_9PLEO|nr:cytochrome P450 [Amniculicola lignicola CBS 123094]
MIIVILFILLLFFCVTVGTYRLIFSPIARFPGPKLAGLTWWYEFYYDVIQHGQYYKEIERLHAVHGPIIRINPTELHIRDADWYSELFTSSARQREKSAWFTAGTAGTSAFGAISHSLHRIRRGALSPFFSKQAVVRLEPFVQERVNRLCAFLKESREAKEVVNMCTAYAGLATDIVSAYSFGRHSNLVGDQAASAKWDSVLQSVVEANITLRHMPWLGAILMRLPDPIAGLISEPISFLGKFLKDMKAQVEATLAQKGEKSTEHRTIFEELRDSKLPPEERTVARLVDEAAIVVGAGSHTTAHTLAMMTYHLLNTPASLEKLLADLDSAMPDPNICLSWQELEQLPYLRASILEAHRITSLLTTRLIRIAPDETLHYKSYFIPPGTPISMSTHFMHLDPTIFPSPLEFRPERFLDDASRGLEKYIMPYSKGSRACIGQNLAQAEIYLTAANVFRKYELALFETTYQDVEITWDNFSGGLRKDSRGVRVRVAKQRS